MAEKTYHRLRWHILPWGTDPNDWLDRDGLGLSNGTPVRITKRAGAVFVIQIGNATEVADGLSKCAAKLDALEVGQWG